MTTATNDVFIGLLGGGGGGGGGGVFDGWWRGLPPSPPVGKTLHGGLEVRIFLKFIRCRLLQKV